MVVKPHLDFISHSPEQTHITGELLGGVCQGGEVIWLEGPLGAGKTVLAQGIARGLGVEEAVTSPTFMLLKEYSGRLPFNHFDFYRLEGSERNISLEFAEYQDSRAVCVVEWAEYAPGFLPDQYLHLQLRYVSATKRAVVLLPVGTRYETLLRQFQAVAFR